MGVMRKYARKLRKKKVLKKVHLIIHALALYMVMGTDIGRMLKYVKNFRSLKSRFIFVSLIINNKQINQLKTIIKF